ncbi:MAG: hypothetical protein NUV80_07455 [Candidatus Berkelbacteria bacterium]|nr:hypothetical protein [Candidatus Berkelbacteria bacterium]
MTMTFEEVKERLAKIDEISLLEILDIASEDLVNKFEDKIEERIDELAREFEEEDSETEFEE